MPSALGRYSYKRSFRGHTNIILLKVHTITLTKTEMKRFVYLCIKVLMLTVFVSFQTTMISLEALPKVIDSSQLTLDLDGTLPYDHAQWIDLRLVSINN